MARTDPRPHMRKRVVVWCAYCNKEMSLWPSDIARGKKCCSLACDRALKSRANYDAARGSKRCAQCNQWKPLSAFPDQKRRSGAHGKQAYCSPCGIEKNKQWRLANPKRRREIAHRSYWKDPEKRRQVARAFADRNRERKNAAAREYRKLNPEKVRWWNKLRLHRLRAAGQMPNRWHFGRLLCEQDARCAYCRVLFHEAPYEIDHKTPVSRGGTNDAENLQLVCPTCNMKKGAKTDAEYMALIGKRGVAVYAE